MRGLTRTDSEAATSGSIDACAETRSVGCGGVTKTGDHMSGSQEAGHVVRRGMFMLASGVARAASRHDGLRQRLVESGRRIPWSPVRAGAQRYFCDTVAFLRPVTGWTVTVDGVRLYVDTTDLIQRSIMVGGEWEPTLSSLLRSLLRGGDSFVDVGANIGYDTLLARTRIGPGAYLRAIEASPDIYRLLVANLEANGVPADVALQAAVADRRGKVLIKSGPVRNIGRTYTVPVDGSFAAHRAGAPPLSVSCAPLDELVADLPVDRALVLKVDIEGAERDAASGLERVLAGGSSEVALHIEVNPTQSGDSLDREWLTALAERQGMSMYRVPNGYKLFDRYPRGPRMVVPIDVVGTQAATDFLLVRGTQMTGRLAAWIADPGARNSR
jgi:FkbM family methyltransferase